MVICIYEKRSDKPIEMHLVAAIEAVAAWQYGNVDNCSHVFNTKVHGSSDHFMIGTTVKQGHDMW